MRTIDEFRAHSPKVIRTRAQPDLQMIAQEAVRVEALTGDATWDRYNAYFEAAIKNATRMLVDLEGRLRDSALVNDDAIRGLRVQIACMQTRIDTLKEVLLFPKYLVQRGALAKAQIEDLEKGA